jgi:proline racemase
MAKRPMQRWIAQRPFRGQRARRASPSHGELGLNEKITIEGIVGSTMTMQAVSEAAFGFYRAIVPEIIGTAHVTRRNEFWFDLDGPFAAAFIVRDRSSGYS